MESPRRRPVAAAGAPSRASAPGVTTANAAEKALTRALEFCRRVPVRGAAIADALGALDFRHRHVLCAHHHRDAAGEMIGSQQIRCMRLRGTAAGAEDIVLK